MINYDKHRLVMVTKDRTGSTLTIQNASSETDSGNYTCSPHNLRPDMVAVHILGGNSESGLKPSEVIAAEETAAAAVQDQDEAGQQGSQIADFHSSANTVNVAKTKNLTLILKLLTLVITILVSGDFRANCS